MILLAVAQAGIFLLAGIVAWALANFSFGPVYSPEVADRARTASALLSWGVLNVVALIAWLIRRRRWGSIVFAVVQAMNAAYVGYLYLAVQSTAEPPALLLAWLFAALPIVSLGLQYVLWRRGDEIVTLRPPGPRAVASGLCGALIGVTVYAAVLLPLIAARANLPHVYTAKELLAEPEGQLIFPGAVVVRLSTQDMIPESIAPEQRAEVDRELLITSSPFDVMPWYRDQLTTIGGWTIAPYTESGSYLWLKGRLIFQLAVCGDGGDAYFYPPPCTGLVMTDLSAV